MALKRNEEWVYPDLEKEALRRDAEKATFNLNELYTPGPHRSKENSEVNMRVDSENARKYELMGGLKFGVLPHRDTPTELEKWKKQVLNIDLLPGIPRWRLATSRYGHLDMVRVGSSTDLWMTKKEEDNEE